MKKAIILGLCCLAAISINAKTTLYEVGPFDQLSQSGNINVVYSNNPDSIGWAAFESSEDYSDAIEISNNKGHLNIKEVPGHELGQLPTLRVYSDFLSKVSSEGKAEITVNLSATTPTFSASLVGNGRIICDNIKSTDVSGTITTGNGLIVMRGKCTTANFKLTGTGTIQADGLAAREVKCFALGTGTIGCSPQDKLDVRGMGSTKIYYSGDPVIKKVGGAKLLKITDAPTDALPEVSNNDTDELEDAEEIDENPEIETSATTMPETEGVEEVEEITVVEETTL